MTAELPAVDQAAVEAYWQRVVARVGTPLPAAVGPFGDSVELADQLVELVIQGTKRATAGAFAQYELEDEPLPAPGDLWIVTDGTGAPRALVRTTEVRVGSLDSVDDAFAWDEGEGDRSRSGWLADHEAYFRRLMPTIGLAFTPDMPTVFERFEVDHLVRAPGTREL